MIRTTVMLPEELKFQAERIARRNGISFGRFIRISIEKAVRGAEKSGREDAFFADQTVWRGDAPRDGAVHHDKYLYGRPK
jgi:hypothetical protein